MRIEAASTAAASQGAITVPATLQSQQLDKSGVVRLTSTTDPDTNKYKHQHNPRPSSVTSLGLDGVRQCEGHSLKPEFAGDKLRRAELDLKTGSEN